jgi:hypothetical protein
MTTTLYLITWTATAEGELKHAYRQGPDAAYALADELRAKGARMVDVWQHAPSREA